MMGYISTVEESIILLINDDVLLFITDFEYEDLLYFPPLIYSLIPTAGNLFLPYKREVLQVSTNSYKV